MNKHIGERSEWSFSKKTPAQIEPAFLLCIQKDYFFDFLSFLSFLPFLSLPSFLASFFALAAIFSSTAAWAAARRAIGTRNGEQLT